MLVFDKLMKLLTAIFAVLLSACAQHHRGALPMKDNEIIQTEIHQIGPYYSINKTIHTRNFIVQNHKSKHWKTYHNKHEQHPLSSRIEGSFRCTNDNEVENILNNDDNQVTLTVTQLSQNNHLVAQNVRFDAYKDVPGFKPWFEKNVQTKATELCGEEFEVSFDEMIQVNSTTFHQDPEEKEMFLKSLTAEVICH